MTAVNDGYALFPTPLGWCGVAWSPAGVLAAQLPEPSAAEARRQLLRSAPDAQLAEPTPLARQAIDGIGALLRGEAVDLSALPLDLRGVPPLHAQVYDIVRRIACGSTLSYGQVAERLGDRQLARAVCPATACSAPTGARAASPPAAACAPSCSCCRSSAPGCRTSPTCLAVRATAGE